MSYNMKQHNIAFYGYYRHMFQKNLIPLKRRLATKKYYSDSACKYVKLRSMPRCTIQASLAKMGQEKLKIQYMLYVKSLANPEADAMDKLPPISSW